MSNHTPGMSSEDQAALGALRARRLMSIALFEAAFLVPLALLFVFDVIPLTAFVIGLVVVMVSFAALLFLAVIRPMSEARRSAVTTADREVPGATGTTGSTREGYDPMKKYR